MNSTGEKTSSFGIIWNKELIERLVQTANINELYWLHGLISGIIEAKANQLAPTVIHPPFETIEQQPSLVTAQPKAATLTVLFATQSGNSRKVARLLEARANERNIPVQVYDMNDYNPNQLKKEKLVAIITSTQGEGDPPLSAEEFYAYIHSPKVGKLSDLNYAVLALGDKSYVNFCKTGRVIDEQLAKLGANRIIDRIDCDIDFIPPAEQWINNLLTSLGKISGSAEPFKSQSEEVKVSASPKISDVFTRTSPGKLVVNEIIHLNGQGSHKDTVHVELFDETEQLTYQPGDSLGIYFKNYDTLVNEILKVTKFNENDNVSYNGTTISIREFLSNKAELTLLTKGFLTKYQNLAKSKKLENVLSDADQLAEFIYGRDLVDILTEFPIKLNAQQLVEIIDPMQARLYSIASSPLYQSGEVHITVGKLNYEFNNRAKSGMCSRFVADELKTGDSLTAYVVENELFRLPADNSGIIMIAQGTGIAPFRAFMQDIEIQGKSNKTWLFFGNPHFTTDFLYQTEWQQWKKKKLLSNIDLAWSRDQKEKIYVQHLLEQKSKEVFDWIENGAHIYICGGKNMGKGVQYTLLQAIQKYKQLDPESAIEYLRSLKKQRRYHEDLY